MTRLAAVPAAAGETLYIVDHDGGEDVVRAVDTRDGTDRWTFSYPDSSRENYGFARATPAVDGDRVYTLSRFGLLHCLDAATGRLVWSKDIVRDFDGQMPKYQMSMSPLIDGEKLLDREFPFDLPFHITQAAANSCADMEPYKVNRKRVGGRFRTSKAGIDNTTKSAGMNPRALRNSALVRGP